jgi:hypothetical protein
VQPACSPAQLLPLVAGISGDDYQHPQAFGAGFRTALVVCSVLLALGGLLGACTIRNPTRTRGTDMLAGRHYCAIGAPPMPTPRRANTP